MEVKMDDISKLLQEAKPLYFARKKRRRRITAVFGMLLVATGLSLTGLQTPESENIYWAEAMLTAADSQITVAQQESLIEDMGLPVDEFGLLMAG